MKKSFTDDNPALAFISHPAASEQEEGGKETKSKRINLLLTPTLHSNLQKIARVEGISFNELVNVVLKAYEQGNQEALKKYAEIWGQA
jgi:predicted HicB family RNase H-like nuclease